MAKFDFRILPILFFSYCLNGNVFAQCSVDQCNVPVPAVNAQNACILPNPAALNCYFGATTFDAPESFPPTWCDAIHNNHWFAFTADASTATFEICVYGCDYLSALQAAVLSTTDCINFLFVSPCLGNMPSGTCHTLTATNLTPGEVYYLCIDGSFGAVCEYAINGINPNISGPTTQLCLPASGPSTYTTNTVSSWSIQPPTAGTILGNTVSTTVDVLWSEPGIAKVCAMSFGCSNAPNVCLAVEIGLDVETTEIVALCENHTVECAGQTFSHGGNFPVMLSTPLGCDSLVNCQVHIIPTAYSTETVNRCPHGTVICAGQEFSTDGDFPVTLTAFQGCDSIVNCKVRVIPAVHTNQYFRRCEGTFVTCAGQEFSTDGNFPVTLTNPQGCDSIVHCIINVVPTTNAPMKTINLCAPASYEVCGEQLTGTGIYNKICTGWLGCDSILNIDLAILEPVAVIAPPDTLKCGVDVVLNGSLSTVNAAFGGATLYTWLGPGIVGPNNQTTVKVNQPGEYCLILQHSRGGVYCSDTACVTVVSNTGIPQMPVLTGVQNPCAGNTLLYTASATGNPAPNSFVWTLPGNHPFITISASSIQVTWSATTPDGQICVTANNVCGASPTACIPISVSQLPIPPVMAGPNSVCTTDVDYLFTLDTVQAGVAYNWSIPTGAILTGSGDTVRINFANAVSGQVCVTAQNNCDTLPALCHAIQVVPNPSADLSGIPQICAGDSLNLAFTLTGNGPFDVLWSNGMQNFILNDILSGHLVSVNPAANTNYSLISVKDHSVPVCTSDIYDNLTVTVLPSYIQAQTIQICEGETAFLEGSFQNISGIYYDSLQTIQGCDSLVVTTLIIHNIDTSVVLLNTCDPAEVGTKTLIMNQLNGCDSIVVTTTSLLPSHSIQIFDSSCDLANVGTFTQNLSNQYGCDSIVTTTVTFSNSDTTLVSLTSCNPADVGVFNQLLIAASDGCDSLVITTVSLLTSSATTLNKQTCNPAEAGVFTTVLTNQNGCDSTITAIVIFNGIPPTILSATTCKSNEVGVFTNTITTAAGCDSTVQTTVNFAGLPPTQLFSATCDSALVGVFTQNLIASDGCDSTVITSVSLVPSHVTMLYGQDCNPANAGVFTQDLSNIFGCDSTVITTVSLLPSHHSVINATTCDPSGVGVFVYPFINSFGCDSIVTKTVSLLPSSTTALALGTCDPSQTGTVIEILKNKFGCDSTVTTVTSLLPISSCSMIANIVGSVIPCGSTTGTLTLTAMLGEGPFEYVISLGNTVVKNGVIASVGVPELVNGLTAGNYTVSYTSALGFTTTVQATIVQLFPPAINVYTTSNHSGFEVSCAGATDGSASASANGGLLPYHYVWSNGSTAQQISNLGAGSYMLTVTDANNCSVTGTTVLNEPTPLQIMFNVADPKCFGLNNGSIVAIANGGVPPYRFSMNNDAQQNSNLFTGLGAGIYTINALDANECETSEIIIMNDPVLLNVDLGTDLNIELGDNASLQAVVNVPYDSLAQVLWNPLPDTVECPQCLTQTVYPLISTSYTVQVIDHNGCRDEDMVRVIVDRSKHLYVPNVFSPNQDGANDFFSVYEKTGSVKNIRFLTLYDRWGEAIFTLTDFLPNDPNIGWNGTFRGQPVNPGVFVWVLEVEFVDGVIELYKGDVTLIR